MPVQYLNDESYLEMACHVFALSGDQDQIADVNRRYSLIGDYLMGMEMLPDNNYDVPAGLNLVTAGAIRNCNNELENGNKQSALELLCAEFGNALQPDSGIRIWGHFEEDQLLPEHMFVTYTNEMVYDTIPNSPVARDENNNGTNPPSSYELEPEVIFSVEVAVLPAGTMAAILRPGPNWVED